MSQLLTAMRRIEAETKEQDRWIERDSHELLLILAGCAAFWFACGMLFMVWLDA